MDESRGYEQCCDEEETHRSTSGNSSFYGFPFLSLFLKNNSGSSVSKVGVVLTTPLWQSERQPCVSVVWMLKWFIQCVCAVRGHLPLSSGD